MGGALTALFYTFNRLVQYGMGGALTALFYTFNRLVQYGMGGALTDFSCAFQQASVVGSWIGGAL